MSTGIVVGEAAGVSGGGRALLTRTGRRYHDNWRARKEAEKEAAGWRCRVCGVPHGPIPNVLTVHHVDGRVEDEDAPILACCQRCHLTCQALRPVPATIEEAIERTRLRVANRDAQRELPLAVQSPADGRRLFGLIAGGSASWEEAEAAIRAEERAACAALDRDRRYRAGGGGVGGAAMSAGRLADEERRAARFVGEWWATVPAPDSGDEAPYGDAAAFRYRQLLRAVWPDSGERVFWLGIRYGRRMRGRKDRDR